MRAGPLCKEDIEESLTYSAALNCWPAALVVGLVHLDASTASRVSKAITQSGLRPPLEYGSPEELPDDQGLDVLVLQLSDDGASAVRVIAAARAALPDVPLVGIRRSSGPGGRNGSPRLGLDGVVLTDRLEATLVPTLRVVLAGLVCVPRGMRDEFNKENLSGRERQVLGMVVMGCTNAEIAAKLYLAESTVKSHLSSVYSKLGVRSRRDATALILDPAAGLHEGILTISAA
jgi:two-component system nitrate/nitrite response regulator NarP